MKPALNPSAIKIGDSYMVINRKENRAVESWGSAGKALHAARILNDHELNNGRPAVFTVLCLSPDTVITGE